jgi:hypothetical protein
VFVELSGVNTEPTPLLLMALGRKLVLFQAFVASACSSMRTRSPSANLRVTDRLGKPASWQAARDTASWLPFGLDKEEA